MAGGGAGAGLLVGAGGLSWRAWRIARYRLPAPDGACAFGAWLRIDRQGGVAVAVPHQEMGQGIYTAVLALIAEELDCDPARMQAISAPLHEVYANPLIVLDGLRLPLGEGDALPGAVRWTLERILRFAGVQVTGGSSSVRNVFRAAREAGATARAMLVEAAARRLEVPVGRLRTVSGRVIDPVSSRSLGYGDLIEEACEVDPPRVVLKSREQFRVVGRGLPRVDTPSKVNGRAQFGIDVRLPGMLFAAIRHAPSVGAKLLHAQPDGGWPPSGATLVKGPDWFAVVASSWWRAHRLLEQVDVNWQLDTHEPIDDSTVMRRYSEALDAGRARECESRGDPVAALSRARRTLAAEYAVPYQPHLTMEPMNCTARVDGQGLTLWVGTQVPTLARRAAAAVAGIPAQRVSVHVPILGCGFGRRLEVDVVQEAVAIAMAVPGRAVQTLWSREEDLRHDVFRPASLCRLRAGLGARGELSALDIQLASPSVASQYLARVAGLGLPARFDQTVVDGLDRPPYDVAHLQVAHAQVDPGVPIGFWRGVGYGTHAFFLESFIDECATAAGEDAYQYRRRLLQHNPRRLRVLEEAARLSGWGRPVFVRRGSKGGRGIAIAECFGSIIAMVVDVEVEGSGEIRVPRVQAVVDCGLIVDRNGVRAQVAGAVVYGLTAAMYARVDLIAGQVRQSNFHDYAVPRMVHTPRIQVDLIESGLSPGGVGELGVGPVAPALANAVFAATGKRLRSLPLRL